MPKILGCELTITKFERDSSGLDLDCFTVELDGYNEPVRQITAYIVVSDSDAWLGRSLVHLTVLSSLLTTAKSEILWLIPTGDVEAIGRYAREFMAKQEEQNIAESCS